MTEQPTTEQPDADIEQIARDALARSGWTMDLDEGMPLVQAALDALAAAGRLLPEGASVVEQLGVRVDEPHPARSERAGQIHTHFPEENARRAREVWRGWTVVRRDRIEWSGPWTPATDENANG